MSQSKPANDPDPQPRQRRQKIRLPFEPKKGDAGEWSYDHRRGIAITVILYLVIGIAFLWGRIDLGNKKSEGIILIDLPEEQEQVELTEEQMRALEAMYEDFSNVRNLTSNENAEFDASLKDSKGIDASALYEEAGTIDDKMRANREAYEAALRQIEENSARTRDGENTGAQNTRVKGSVTVSFSFTDPVRNSVNLIVPAYQCEGGGQVVVNATLDRNGNVTAATVERSASSSDNCMQTTAVQAALRSRFNVDSSAPTRHRGTITYIFIPQ